MFENVKNLVSKKFKPEFDKLIEILDELNYNTYWSVINAKDCGIPQNRERVFAISIRKDIDAGLFTFPKPFDNGLRLLDMLEDETTIADKYYIKSESATKLIQEKIDDGTLEKEFGEQGIDLTINHPNFIEKANCIKARYDAGVISLKYKKVKQND